MIHPVAGLFLVSEASYRRQTLRQDFRAWRRHRPAENGPVTTPRLPRQRSAGSVDTGAYAGTAGQHAA